MLIGVGDEIVPRVLLAAVELGLHRRQRRPELRSDDGKLVVRLDRVDTDHTFLGVIRSQSVQRRIDAALPAAASAPRSTTDTIGSSRGIPTARSPRSG